MLVSHLVHCTQLRVEVQGEKIEKTLQCVAIESCSVQLIRLCSNVKDVLNDDFYLQKPLNLPAHVSSSFDFSLGKLTHGKHFFFSTFHDTAAITVKLGEHSIITKGILDICHGGWNQLQSRST